MVIMDGFKIKENEVVMVISDNNTFVVNRNTESTVSVSISIEFMETENVYVSSAFKNDEKWSMFNHVDCYQNDKFIGETTNPEILEKFNLYRNEKLLNDFLELN